MNDGPHGNARPPEPTLIHRLLSEIRTPGRLQMFVVMALAVAVLLVRKTDAFLHPQFWAEDGHVFFQDQVNLGIAAMVEPYSGYLHLAPRLTAWLAYVFFPFSAAPAVYNYLSLLALLVVILNIYSRRFRFEHKALLSLTMVLVPHCGNEVFMNITNVNWILALLLLVILFKEPPDRQFGTLGGQMAADAAGIGVCGLSGPCIIFAAPFFVGRFWRGKSPYNLRLAGLAVLVATIQGSFLLMGNPLTDGAPAEAGLFATGCAVFGEKMFGNLLLGSTLPYLANPYVLCGYGVLVVSAVAWLAVNCGKGRPIFVLLAFSALILLTTFLKFKEFPEILIPPFLAGRYFYLPSVLFIWSLILCLNQPNKSASQLVVFLLIATLLSSLTSRFHSPPFADLEWAQASQRILKNQLITIPINPPGWSLSVISRK